MVVGYTQAKARDMFRHTHGGPAPESGRKTLRFYVPVLCFMLAQNISAKWGARGVSEIAAPREEEPRRSLPLGRRCLGDRCP